MRVNAALDLLWCYLSWSTCSPSFQNHRAVICSWLIKFVALQLPKPLCILKSSC